MAFQPRTAMKRKRNVLMLVKQIEILDKLESDETVASPSRRYGMNEYSVREIQKNEDTIQRSFMENAPMLLNRVLSRLLVVML